MWHWYSGIYFEILIRAGLHLSLCNRRARILYFEILFFFSFSSSVFAMFGLFNVQWASLAHFSSYPCWACKIINSTRLYIIFHIYFMIFSFFLSLFLPLPATPKWAHCEVYQSKKHDFELYCRLLKKAWYWNINWYNTYKILFFFLIPLLLHNS